VPTVGSTFAGVIARRVAPRVRSAIDRPDQGDAGDGGAPGPRDDPGAAPIHRWRDLDRRSRLAGAAVGAALLVAPVVAFLYFVPRWAPAGDPALMGLRALDVGTSRTPLLGQPSASGMYAESIAHVQHPGPLHFYLMAVPVRLLGGLGMIATSVVITGTCLVGAGWAVFRQLGRRAGVVAALALAAVAFTTGASSLINPVSSSIAGYPLLLTTVLVWSVACGDIRLLPAATAAASFTAQQHLSVVPATVLITAGGLAVLVVRLARSGRLHRGGADRRGLARWGIASAAVALVLWAPPLAQQVFGDTGNLGQMLWFARHGNTDRLGYGMALRQVTHALGLPPLLGRTNLDGAALNAPPSAAASLSAVAVAALVGGLCWRWRRTHPRRALLGVMAGIVAGAGLYNGASVPLGLEQDRLPFYHWALVLAFLVALIGGLAAADLVGAAVARGAVARPALAAVAVVAVALPPLVNTRLDRFSNTDAAAYSTIDRRDLDALTDQVLAHRAELGDRTVLLSRNEPLFAGVRPALSFSLARHGLDVLHPLVDLAFVHDQRLAHRADVDGGIVLVFDAGTEGEAPAGGELVAEVTPGASYDTVALRALVDQIEGADVVIGADLQRAMSAVSDDYARVLTIALDNIARNPAQELLKPPVLDLLAAHPLVSPRLDPTLIRQLRASLPDHPVIGEVSRIRAYLLDRDELLAAAFTIEVGPAG
jgi:hypothetical protein